MNVDLALCLPSEITAIKPMTTTVILFVLGHKKALFTRINTSRASDYEHNMRGSVS